MNFCSNVAIIIVTKYNRSFGALSLCFILKVVKLHPERSQIKYNRERKCILPKSFHLEMHDLVYLFMLKQMYGKDVLVFSFVGLF